MPDSARLDPRDAEGGRRRPATGEIGPAEAFEIEFEDPVRGRGIGQRYAIETPPVEG